MSHSVGFRLPQSNLLVGSWPLFALTHHLVVWWAAEKVRPGKVFRDYAILGDDVVSGDSEVAKWYLYALDQLKVKARRNPCSFGAVCKALYS